MDKYEPDYVDQIEEDPEPPKVTPGKFDLKLFSREYFIDDVIKRYVLHHLTLFAVD